MKLADLLALNEREDVVAALGKSKQTVLRSKEELTDRFREVSVNYMNEIKSQGKSATMSSFRQSVRLPEFRKEMERMTWIKKAIQRFGYKDKNDFWEDMLAAAKQVELQPYTTGVKK